MDNDHSADVISTFDCNIVRDAFRTSVIENHIPENQWQGNAALLIRD
ncbi:MULTISPECIES: hypothetical protein [unclassified Mesorhizobium]|nr:MULTISPECIES: hypothetical protein [unclassified Mesorhizobium]MBZ9812162.1 hypothetical protein [Mesorhizobium sp. CA7]MBZ9845122.1 hypothetical protein [Mesorhizobium sp. CA5]MBZ9862070.1 hypothetical protein [Mesorhizobium sp. CA12]